ncbi:hypothetical protein AgCh_005052 [Apium graveolens]
MRNLAEQSSLPWVILGDFNDILRDSEKKGRHKQPRRMINGFKEAIFDCGISDLPLEDHSALFFQVQVWRHVTRRARFRFENSWLRERRYSEIVEDCWQNSRGSSVELRIDLCARELKAWGDRKLLSQQEYFWKQRAKQHWLKAADNNTRYFHVYASARQRKNDINRLKDDSGVWHDWKLGLGDLIGNFYEQLFKSNEVQCDELLNNIGNKISSEQNQMLTENFTADELSKKMVRLRRTARKSVPGGPYHVEGFRLPEQDPSSGSDSDSEISLTGTPVDPVQPFPEEPVRVVRSPCRFHP